MRRRHIGFGGLLAVALVMAVVASGCVVAGTWAVTTPAASFPANATGDVDCIAADDCVMVVTDRDDSGAIVVQEWNGTSWTEAGRYSGGDGYFTNTRISCWAHDACWVLGPELFTEEIDIYFTALRWDGTSLTRYSAAAFGEIQDTLECPEDDWCIVIDTERSDEIGTWDGTTWDESDSSLPADFRGHYGPTACAAARSCVTVPYDFAEPVAVHMEAGVAEVVPFPLDDVLPTSVDCLSVNSCVAVGTAGAASWNGTSWTTKELHPSGSTRMVVDCAQADECVAVGVQDLGGGATQVVVRTWWGGTEWAAGTAPTAGVHALKAIREVACAADDEMCMIVGDDATGAGMAVRYSWAEVA